MPDRRRVSGPGGHVSTEELVKQREDEEPSRSKARPEEFEDDVANRELDLATLRCELLDFDLRFRAIGTRHTVAPKGDGSIWAWEGNVFSQLGLGDHGQGLLPASIGDSSSWTVVCVGGHHPLTLTSDGRSRAWGVTTPAVSGRRRHESGGGHSRHAPLLRPDKKRQPWGPRRESWR